MMQDERANMGQLASQGFSFAGPDAESRVCGQTKARQPESQKARPPPIPQLAANLFLKPGTRTCSANLGANVGRCVPGVRGWMCQWSSLLARQKRVG